MNEFREEKIRIEGSISIINEAIKQLSAQVKERLNTQLEKLFDLAELNQKKSLAELDDLFGFGVAAALDSIGQATTGTRETLLKESGRWRGRLCTVFFDHDRVTPVFVWSLMRAISLLRDTNPESPKPLAPTLHGRAPDLPVTNGESS